jgi:hypothetical protein
MTAAQFAENCRQLAFVSSLVAGFAFTFYGVLLAAPSAHRFASWAGFLAMAASLMLLLVTLGDTFAAVLAATLPTDAAIPSSLAGRKFALDICFLSAAVPLFASFGLGGWIRSRQLGIATTIAASLALICVFVVLKPYMHY